MSSLKLMILELLLGFLFGCTIMLLYLIINRAVCDTTGIKILVFKWKTPHKLRNAFLNPLCSVYRFQVHSF